LTDASCRVRQPRVSGVVLAGGESRRLGRNTALQRIGDQTLIERVVGCIAPVSAEVIVVVASPAKAAALPLPAEVRVVSDRYPRCGSLGGIFTGLSASRESWILLVACDMPFLDPRLMRRLMAMRRGVDAVVPCLNERPEPLHALYSKVCLEPMERMLQMGLLKIAPLFEMVRVRYVDERTIDRIDPHHRSFFNVNSPADVEEALGLLSEPACRTTRGPEPPTATNGN
jgi:molybdopterin-guanine dinucleotide biosynthesis protein A